jgi:hypothetical protein
MRWLPTALGVTAAFLMGAALAIATNPRPLFREIVASLTGASYFDRCRHAGACNAVQGIQPAPRQRLKPPPDLDRA